MSAVLQDRPGEGVEVTRRLPGQDALLTPAALGFLADLHRRFEGERQARLAARRVRQQAFGKFVALRRGKHILQTSFNGFGKRNFCHDDDCAFHKFCNRRLT